ncbi:NACHT domain-containing protein [Aliarcobacter butzleri]|uniref:NACHT domain-containing protein n=1 Tax=Aliarcobacter butzleri TaxID=28197 RepID=UPI0019183D81|nr:pentapeptide repeat-containing protein [Aliarcobacter butzleri]
MLLGIYGVVIFIIIAALIYEITKLYFSYIVKTQTSPNYPFKLAIISISVPIINFLIPFDNVIIDILNKYLPLDLPINEKSIGTYIIYFLYLLAVIMILFLYNKFSESKVEKELLKEDNYKLEFSNEEIIYNPIFNERIKELFELKFEKNSLLLKYDSLEKVLIGEYSEAFHSHRYIIYCDDCNTNITKDMQKNINTKLEKINESLNDEFHVNYFYFIKEGKFEDSHSKLKCYTENDFIKNIIDFSKYLQKNIELFNNSTTELGGGSISKSFNMPYYNNGKENLTKLLDDWLKEEGHKHIALLASYGMGKTTFLKYYTQYLSTKILENDEFIRYPIFISLTNTSPMSNDGINTKIESFVSNELAVNFKLFKKLMDLGKLVFILDGFDEMGFIGTSKIRFQQFNSIWKLATKNNKILISGRPNYLPTINERKNFLNIVDKELQSSQILPYTEVIELDKFNIDQIENTIHIYYTNKKDATKYLKYIKENKSILDLCSRPSMLHMTMLIMPELYKEYPNKKITSSIIMEKYIEFWISRQESKRITGIFQQNDNVKKDFIKDLFTDLAYKMYIDDTLVYNKNKIENLIDEKLKDLKLNDREDHIEGFKNEIFTSYFIETDYTLDNDDFKFVHKSFFEFFVAKAIIKFIKMNKFSNEIFTMKWSSEILDFIDESVDVLDEKKVFKYPKLILIKNNFIDKYIIIPFTKIFLLKNVVILFFVFYFSIIITLFYKNYNNTLSLSQNNSSITLNEFLILLVILVCIFVIKNRLVKNYRFVSQSFYLEFRKSCDGVKINSMQLRHFLENNKFFRVLENVQFKNYTFEKLNYLKLNFFNSEIENVQIVSSDVRELNFNNCQINKLTFDSSSITKLEFIKCNIENLMFNKISIRKKYIYRYFFLINYILFFFIYKYIFRKEFFYLKRRFVSVERILITFKSNTIDDYSMDQLKSLIRRNNLKKKNINASKEIKDKLFS